ncbi:MAG: carbamate kinase [Clostridia bacterium]|nr:carbamate kinase [Clostridia bacterium]
MKKVVIALGGNALEDKNLPPTAESQLKVVHETAKQLAKISNAGHELAIVHGNGPQIGRILLASETAKEVTPPMPFDVCGAMSQGYIGYHIQQALYDELRKSGRDIPIVTVITQVIVDKNDPAFDNPTKPIGPFYSEQEASVLEKTKGYVMKEDSGKGWRRVVPSPKPIGIAEIGTVKNLWDSTITVACGGGGIPVVKDEKGNLKGIAAVIDKDFAAEELAEEMDADILMILTEVENVAINFGKPEQENLKKVGIQEIEEYIKQNHFAPGSMLPKVEAAVKFAKSKEGRKAIITSLYKGCEALEGGAGTHIG